MVEVAYRRSLLMLNVQSYLLLCSTARSKLMARTRSSRSVSTSTLPPRKIPKGSKNYMHAIQLNKIEEEMLYCFQCLSTRCRHKNKNYPHDSSIDEKPTKDNGTSNKRRHHCSMLFSSMPYYWMLSCGGLYCKGCIQRLFCFSCYHYFKTRRRS